LSSVCGPNKLWFTSVGIICSARYIANTAISIPIGTPFIALVTASKKKTGTKIENNVFTMRIILNPADFPEMQILNLC
jgi:hypothetical protein